MSKLEGFQRILCWLRPILASLRLSTSGKITLVAICGIAIGLFIAVGIITYNVRVPAAYADNVTTSVTVLNTPPVWTIDAEELVASATSTPTNAGQVITWTAVGTDSNADNYYLIICKTSASPTAVSGGAPTCGGGVSNQWAASGSTVSGATASAATTTKETFPFNIEKNDWYAWICDDNASLAQCNATFKQIGPGGVTKGSPFVINHPPIFTAIVNSSPVVPGAGITWTSTATDTDLIRGGDTVQLIVCKANDFTGTSCGPGGAWATSTFATFNPATTSVMAIPTQDKVYSAFVFIVDNNFAAATSTLQATNSSFTVTNVVPTISASSVTLVDPVHSSTTIVLSVPNGQSGPYWVQFQATDNNSCLNASSGNEIATVLPNVYRNGSGVSSTTCLGGAYNSNNCYSATSTLSNFVCTQDAGSCSGSSDATATFTCSFSLWYNADPTDTGSVYAALNWAADVTVSDDNFATSSLTESTTGSKDLISFLAFNVVQAAIAYGGLQPGQQIDPFVVATSTTIRELGNTGIDETLYGDTMCTTWSGTDSCDHQGVNSTNSIPITNQKAATSTIAYGSANAFTILGSTTPVLVGLHVPKTTATSSPQTKDTLWAIKIPSAITVAGSYTGQNTITALTSSSTNW